MTGYYIIIGAIALVSWLVSARLKSKFQHYSKVHLQNGMSGAEIAEKMLADNGIRDVIRHCGADFLRLRLGVGFDRNRLVADVVDAEEVREVQLGRRAGLHADALRAVGLADPHPAVAHLDDDDVGLGALLEREAERVEQIPEQPSLLLPPRYGGALPDDDPRVLGVFRFRTHRDPIIDGDWIKPGAVVIDVGINRVKVEVGGKKKTKIVGDVEFDAASLKPLLDDWFDGRCRQTRTAIEHAAAIVFYRQERQRRESWRQCDAGRPGIRRD